MSGKKVQAGVNAKPITDFTFPPAYFNTTGVLGSILGQNKQHSLWASGNIEA
jgi:hypothetical protein